MRYWIYISTFILILLVIFALNKFLGYEQSEKEITGSENCSRCHGLKKLGDQQTWWKNDAHSRAYNSLLKDEAKQYSVKMGLQNSHENVICLSCHTTKYFLKTNTRKEYNISEGVGCEACHGAGSLYSPANMHSTRENFLNYGGNIADEKTCLKCHSEKGNPLMELKENLCPFQKDDFIYPDALLKIKHSLPQTNK